MKIVLVSWRDSGFVMGNMTEVEGVDKGVVVLETVGFLVSDTKDALVVAGDRDAADGRVRCVTTIPRECVVKVKILK